MSGAASTQPELPTFFGNKPDEVVVDLSGQPYRSTLHAFTPGDDEVYLLVRCRVGKSTFSPPGDGGRTMRQALTALAGYPVDPDFGRERIEQLAIAHEHREDEHARATAKAHAGRLDFAPGDPRLEGLADTPHAFLRGLAGETADACQIPGCDRPPSDPIHHLEENDR